MREAARSGRYSIQELADSFAPVFHEGLRVRTERPVMRTAMGWWGVKYAYRESSWTDKWLGSCKCPPL